MGNPTGEADKSVLRLDFDRRLLLQFRGSALTSDAGLLAYRELNDTLGLTDGGTDTLADARIGKNGRHRLAGLLCQSVCGRLANYEDVNEADRLCRDPAMLWVVGHRATTGSAASASQIDRFETKWLSRPEKLVALADLPGQWRSSGSALAARCCAAFRVALACISASQIVACTAGDRQLQSYERPIQTTIGGKTGTTGTTGGMTGASTREGSILPSGNWRLVLDDEFNGNSIDQSIWTGIPPDGGGIDGQGCAVNSLATSVGGGFLTLRGVDPSHCPNPNYRPAGVCSSPCAGGEIITSPIYGPGYYEARLKGAGNYNAFWLEAQITPCLPLDKGGFESDIMESWGGNGYQNNTHWGGYGDCAQSSGVGSLSPIADTFHVIGVLWDPDGGLTYYRDGQQTSHVPGPVGSTPVDIRFTALGYADSDAPLVVDWVRYYVRSSIASIF